MANGGVDEIRALQESIRERRGQTGDVEDITSIQETARKRRSVEIGATQQDARDRTKDIRLPEIPQRPDVAVPRQAPESQVADLVEGIQSRERNAEQNLQSFRDIFGVDGRVGPGVAVPSTTGVAELTAPLKVTIGDEVQDFFTSLGPGFAEGFTGLDIPTDESVGGDVGDVAGNLLGFGAAVALTGGLTTTIGKTVAAKFPQFLGATQKFKSLSPVAQDVIRQTIIGGSMEGVQQSARGIAGQETDLLQIPETAVLFGGFQAALSKIGLSGNTVFKTDKSSLISAAQVEFAPFVKPGRTSAAKKAIGEVLKTPNSIKEAFFQSRNLLKSPAGKEVVKKGDNMFAEIGVSEGLAKERIRELGVEKLSKADRIALTDILEQTSRNGVVNPAANATPKQIEQAQGLRRLLNERHAEAIAPDVGVNAGFLDNFAPRFMTEKNSNKIFGDIRSAEKQIAGLASSKEGGIDAGRLLADRVIEGRIKQQIANAKFSNTTERAVESMMESAGVDRYTAIVKLQKQSANQLFMPFGNLERNRVIEDLPLDLYERDILKIMEKYIEGSSRRIAEAREFGASGEKALQLLDKIQQQSPGEVANARRVIENMLRITERNTQVISPGLRKVQDAYINFRVGTAIGLGFAAVPNMAQTLISTFAQHGLIKTGRGFGTLLTKQGRKTVRQSGATWLDAHRLAFGEEGRGAFRTFAKVTTAPFNAINSFNKALAAATSKEAIPIYHAQAQGTGKLARVAKERLRKMGIDHTRPLTQRAILKGMNIFANSSQLQRMSLNEPLWFANQRLKPFILFKSFGIKQANFIKDNILREALPVRFGGQGNPLPTLRLLAGGLAGGAFVNFGKDQIRDFLAPDRKYEPKRDIFERAINNLAASGAAGVLSDLSDVKFDEDIREDVLARLSFAVSPVVISDMAKLANPLRPQQSILGSLVLSKDLEMGMQEASSKFVKAFGGSLTKYALGERLETREQKRRRIAGERKRARR